MLLSHSSSFAVNGRHFLSWPLSILSPTLPLGGGWSRLSGDELGRRSQSTFPDFSSLPALEEWSSIRKQIFGLLLSVPILQGSLPRVVASKDPITQ